MSIFDINLASKMKTRPCDFSLCMLDSSIYADFGIEKKQKLVRLLRISFDGYGCRQCSNMPCMGADDSKILLQAVQEGQLDDDSIIPILRRYFGKHRDYLWPDALEEYGLLPTS